jgi:probable rRNA maturation factor
MAIDVAVYNTHGRRRAGKELIAGCVRTVLGGERRKSASISVVLVDDAAMARLNRRYLSHRGSTDVISFPLEQGANLEGEIYVDLDRAQEQAGRYGVSANEELARLVIHGTLHLLGYDDRREREALRMKNREDRYVAWVARREKRQGSYERKGG